MQRSLWPRGSVACALSGYSIMFWTDWSSNNPRIMKSSMAGYNITTLISNSVPNVTLKWPNGGWPSVSRQAGGISASVL